MNADPALAERAFRQHFRKVIAAQENKDAIIQQAVEAPKTNPPQTDTPGEISETFFSRFEQYSEVASSDEVRALFGAILAGEIRKPGAVSGATMHFASMLDISTAKLIERVLPLINLLGQAYLECISPELTVAEIAHLEMASFWSAGKISEITLDQDGRIFVPIDEINGILIEGTSQQKLNLDVAILSPAGSALSKILESNFDVTAFAKCVQKKELWLANLAAFNTK